MGKKGHFSENKKEENPLKETRRLPITDQEAQSKKFQNFQKIT